MVAINKKDERRMGVASVIKPSYQIYLKNNSLSLSTLKRLTNDK